MKRDSFEKSFLRWAFIINVAVAIILIRRKPPIKDWLLVYTLNAVTNLCIDRALVSLGILEYPVRLMPKMFKSNFLFDLLTYPTLDVLYNQMTYKSKPIPAVFKFIYFVIPLLAVEWWAVRKTRLIKWGKGWGLFESFITVVIKSIVTRYFMSLIRKISSLNEEANKENF